MVSPYTSIIRCTLHMLQVAYCTKESMLFPCSLIPGIMPECVTMPECDILSRCESHLMYFWGHFQLQINRLFFLSFSVYILVSRKCTDFCFRQNLSIDDWVSCLLIRLFLCHIKLFLFRSEGLLSHKGTLFC